MANGWHRPRPTAGDRSSNASRRPAEHFVRQIEAGQFGVAIGILEQVAGDLAGAAAHVEDPLRAMQIKLSLSQQTLPQNRMQGNEAARGQHRTLGPVVDVANLLPIFLSTEVADQPVFQQPVDDLACFGATARDLGREVGDLTRRVMRWCRSLIVELRSRFRPSALRFPFP